MARVSSSQAGPADLPQLVERLHAGGTTAVADLLQEELETIIDDLPLALEAESIRDHLPAILGRMESRLDRTFRRVIEIARQDEERTGLLLQSLVMLPWRGTASEDEFAWLVQQMSRNADPASRLAAFRRCATLELHTAQVAILDALGSIHPDEAIRTADAERRRAAAMPGAAKPPETTGDLVRAHEAERQAEPTPPPPPELDAAADDGGPATDLPLEADHTAATDPGDYEPAPHPDDAPETPAVSWDAASAQMSDELAAEDAAANAVTPPPPADPGGEAVEDAQAPVYDESASPQETWDHKEEPPPDKLTVRTLLRSLEAPPVANLAAASALAPETNGNGAEAHPEDEPTVADEEVLEPTPHVENSLTGETNAAADTANDESSSPEAAAAAAEPAPRKADPITVRTLLASLDSVMLSNAPDEEPAPADPDPVIDESAGDWTAPAEPDPDQQRVTVMTMLRSLETVRVKMAALEDTPAVDTPVEGTGADGASAEVAPVTDARPVEPAPPTPKAEAKPWSDVDLKPLSPPDRARRLAKVRRALETPELKRGYLAWLFDREKDTFSVVSVRKEILEFAFERPVFLGFDDATRARLARWIRERTAADQIAPAAVLAALRRATWTEGEPPEVDDKTRPIVDAATGTLSRVPSEERTALYNRDFTAWLFSIREWEDREVLDRYARDPSPGVAEGLFRALAAMDGLAARFGGTGGESALQTALGIWDRADNEGRAELAKAIAAGWSRGLVLDRRAFFNEFWSRHQKHEAQRPAILVALTSFEKEIEAAQAKDTAAAAPAQEPPPKKVETPRGGTAKPVFAEPPKDPAPGTTKTAGSTEIAPREPARTPVVAKEVTKPPISPKADVTRPSMRMPEDTPPPETPRPIAKEVTKPPAATVAAPANPFAEPPTDSSAPQEEGTDRFFRMMRKNMEAGMRAGAAPAPAPVEADDSGDDVVPEEGDAVDSDAIPDEGDAVLADSSAPKPNPLASQRPTLPPAQSAAAPKPSASGDSRDEEIVLPNEPLRSLAEYTRFLKALSAGRPIDELLSAHAMDYKQYAGCMTAWGRLLQNRPDLALRMGQLLRATS